MPVTDSQAVTEPRRASRRARPTTVGAELLAAGLTIALLVACSSGSSSGPAVANPSQASSAGVSTSAATSSVVPPPTEATTTPTTAATTATTPTTPPPTPPPTPAAASPTSTADYRPTSTPAFPTSAALPKGDGLPDGTYYAVVTEGTPVGKPPGVTVSIYVLLTGGPAIAAAAADGVGLDSDVYVRSAPFASRQIPLAAPLTISVAQPDKPDVSYVVSGEELQRLIGGAAPSAGHPPTYHYIPFPYLLTVAGGHPVRFQQLWSQ